MTRRAAAGVRWLSLASAVSAGAMLLQTLVLARMLSPKAFGAMAAATIITTFARAFADGGVSQALLRAERLSPTTLSSLYWFNIAVGFALSISIYALAPVIATLFSAPEVLSVVRWVSVTFLVLATGIQFEVLLQRALHFRLLATAQIAGAVTGCCVAIGAASAGAAAVALAWGWMAPFLVQSLTYAVIGWRKWRPRSHFRVTDLRPYWRFGLFRVGDRLLNAATANLDYLAVGISLGPAALGAYSLAYQLVIRPLIYINPTVVNVAFPIFARRQDDARALAYGLGNVLRLLGYLAVPFLVAVAVYAPTLVPLVLGADWGAVAPLLQALWLAGVLRCFCNAAVPVALARGRADYGFRINLVAVLLMVPVLAATSTISTLAVAIGVVVICIVQSLLWLSAVRSEIGFRLNDAWTYLRSPLACCGIAVVAVGLTFGGLHALSPPSALGAITMVTVGVLAYLSAVAAIDRHYLRTVWTLLRSRSAESSLPA